MISVRLASIGIVSLVALQAPEQFWVSKMAAVDFATGALLEPPVDITIRVGAATLFYGDWSADGTSLVLVSDDEDPGPRSLFIRSTSGVLKEVRTSLTGFQRPMWAPNGRSFLARGSSDSNDCCGLYVIDIDSGQARRVAERADLLYGWTVDGQRALFNRENKISLETELISLTIASGAERVIHRWYGGEAVNIGIAVSPDLTTVYFRDPPSSAAPTHRLIARDVETGRDRIVADSIFIGTVSVSAHGQFVIISGEDMPLVVPAAGGVPRALPRVSGHTPAILAWGPGDRSFLGRVTATDPSGTSPVSYWWIPMRTDGAGPRKLDWSVGPSAYGFSVGGSRVVFMERVSRR